MTAEPIVFSLDSTELMVDDHDDVLKSLPLQRLGEVRSLRPSCSRTKAAIVGAWLRRASYGARTCVSQLPRRRHRRGLGPLGAHSEWTRRLASMRPSPPRGGLGRIIPTHDGLSRGNSGRRLHCDLCHNACGRPSRARPLVPGVCVPDGRGPLSSSFAAIGARLRRARLDVALAPEMQVAAHERRSVKSTVVKGRSPEQASAMSLDASPAALGDRAGTDGDALAGFLMGRLLL